MSNLTSFVILRIYINEMMAYFKNSNEYGITKAKPYPADSFYELISPSSVFYGSLRNIMVFRSSCIYRWVLESYEGIQLRFSNENVGDFGIMKMEMIVEPNPTKEDWKKIFVFEEEPDVELDGKLKVKNTIQNENIFELETTRDILNHCKIKYSILFEFEDSEGNTKYGSIDPYSDTTIPPPQWPY